MTDLFVYALCVALIFAKFILVALLIIIAWGYIKKNQPKTAESIKSRYTNTRDSIKSTVNSGLGANQSQETKRENA